MSQFLGQVIGTKMNKTAKVLVTRLKLHPVLKKYWRHKQVFFAHDENNECRDGDMVIIKSCQKMSKKKTFLVHEIVEKSPLYDFELPANENSWKKKVENIKTIEVDSKS